MQHNSNNNNYVAIHFIKCVTIKIILHSKILSMLFKKQLYRFIGKNLLPITYFPYCTYTMLSINCNIN